MTVASAASVLSAAGRTPTLDPTAFVAAGARVVGSVTLREGASVWYNAVLRADGDTITVGAGSNLQDNVSVHVDPGHPVVIGQNVSVGHNAVVHGCTIGDGSLIGMGAVVPPAPSSATGASSRAAPLCSRAPSSRPARSSPAYPRRSDESSLTGSAPASSATPRCTAGTSPSTRTRVPLSGSVISRRWRRDGARHGRSRTPARSWSPEGSRSACHP
jgi:serine acetyltransferase